MTIEGSSRFWAIRQQYRIRPKTCKIGLKRAFCRRISKLKLPKYQILKLTDSKPYKAILQVFTFIL